MVNYRNRGWGDIFLCLVCDSTKHLSLVLFKVECSMKMNDRVVSIKISSSVDRWQLQQRHCACYHFRCQQQEGWWLSRDGSDLGEVVPRLHENIQWRQHIRQLFCRGKTCFWSFWTIFLNNEFNIECFWTFREQYNQHWMRPFLKQSISNIYLHFFWKIWSVQIAWLFQTV